MRLVARIRAGDQQAMSELYDRYSKVVYAVALRVLQDTTAAEDVLQETFLAAWQAIPRLDLRVRFKTWLFSIAVHKAADYHRAQVARS